MNTYDPNIKVVAKKILVKNFKSLRDFELSLNKVNVIVGKNGSGKTNLIEALKLFKKTIDFIQGKEINPFLEWWGYDNVVWNHDEELPIKLGLEYTTEYDNVKIPAKYILTVSGRGGTFMVLEEEVVIPKMIQIKVRQNFAIIKFDKTWLKKVIQNAKKHPPSRQQVPIPLLVPRSYLYEVYLDYLKKHEEYTKLENINSRKIIKMAEETLSKEIWIIKQTYLENLLKQSEAKVNGKTGGLLIEHVIDALRLGGLDSIELAEDIISDILGMAIGKDFEMYLQNNLEEIIDEYNLNLVQKIFFENEYRQLTLDMYIESSPYKILARSTVEVFTELNNLLRGLAIAIVGAYHLANRSVILKRLDYKTLKEPVKLKKELTISEDGSNLASVLYSLSKGKIPERIKRAIEKTFGANCSVYLEPTTDGRIYIKFYEHGKEWNPPSIPDGLYKLIALELALEYKAPIIAVDEMENSLHADAIRYFIDEVKTSSSVAILTTHSPAVMDFSRPEDIVIFHKVSDGETIPSRFSDPVQIKKMLTEEGITLSEYILYTENFDR